MSKVRPWVQRTAYTASIVNKWWAYSSMFVKVGIRMIIARDVIVIIAIKVGTRNTMIHILRGQSTRSIFVNAWTWWVYKSCRCCDCLRIYLRALQRGGIRFRFSPVNWYLYRLRFCITWWSCVTQVWHIIGCYLSKEGGVGYMQCYLISRSLWMI